MNMRDDTIRTIKTALQRRSGQVWSVTGGRGTAWGWITIDAPPERRTWNFVLPADLPDRSESYIEQDMGQPRGHMSPADRATLARLLGLEIVHHQGQMIRASSCDYAEYIARAEGRTPGRIAEQYWD